MRHQATSSVQALYRVFVLPTIQQKTATTSTKTAASALQCRVPVHQYVRNMVTTTKPINHTSPSLLLRQHHPSNIPNPSPQQHRLYATRPPEKRTQLWDEEIPARLIALVDPETNELLPPQGKAFLLRTIDRKTHRIVLVGSPPPPQDAGNRHNRPEYIPTCRLLSKKEMWESEKAKKSQLAQAKKKNTDALAKTVELGWAIDTNDLAHRMKKLTAFLLEGRKVEVVLARKKGARKATVEECQALVKKVLDVVEGVKGAKVMKPMEGKVGGVTTLFFDGGKVKEEMEKEARREAKMQEKMKAKKEGEEDGVKKEEEIKMSVDQTQ